MILILPSVRDPRLITIRRGGLLSDADHQLLALWAAQCAEHVLDLFEAQQPSDARPRDSIEAARCWARGEMKMMEARARGGHAMGAARPLRCCPVRRLCRRPSSLRGACPRARSRRRGLRDQGRSDSGSEQRQRGTA